MDLFHMGTSVKEPIKNIWKGEGNFLSVTFNMGQSSFFTAIALVVNW